MRGTTNRRNQARASSCLRNTQRLTLKIVAIILAWLCWARPQPVTAASPVDDGSRGAMIKALEAPGPHASLGNDARLFDRLVGTWQTDFANFDEDGTAHRSTGEVTFGWIIDGRAVQDVWTWRPSARSGQDRGIGTTVRIFDTKLKKWRIVWVLPEANIIQTLVGGEVDDRIELEGTAPDGALLRWTFNDIRDDSFVWRGEKSRDRGKTWRVTGEYQMHRGAPR